MTYKPTSYLTFRFANTKTLTRPDYSSIVPMLRAAGAGNGTLDWRNKTLEPGISSNTDLSVSLLEDKLGLLTVSYFQKSIEDLIYSSGSRIYFDTDTADFGIQSDYVNFKILNSDRIWGVPNRNIGFCDRNIYLCIGHRFTDKG